MSGLPFLQFYPGDWLKDTRALSPEAKGAWIDILCALHFSSTRGQLSMTMEGWARTVGQSPQNMRICVNELKLLGICDCHESNGVVTLMSRRMLRESITKEQTRQRVAKSRQAKHAQPTTPQEKDPCNAVVRQSNGEEARNHKPEARIQSLPDKPAEAAKPEPSPKPLRTPNPLFDALAFESGENPGMCGGKIGKALAAIKTICPTVTPEEIHRRAENHRKLWPNLTVSSTSLAGNWPKFDHVNGHTADPCANRIQERVAKAKADEAASYDHF